MLKSKTNLAFKNLFFKPWSYEGNFIIIQKDSIQRKLYPRMHYIQRKKKMKLSAGEMNYKQPQKLKLKIKTKQKSLAEVAFVILTET